MNLRRPILANDKALINIDASTSAQPMERVIMSSIEHVRNDANLEVAECLLQLQATHVEDTTRKIEELSETEQLNQSVVQKDPELKELPKHLKYVFLGENPLQHVIIRSLLSKVEEEKLLRVHKTHRGALGWSVDDLKGISPTYCMHKIKLEEEFMPVV